MNLLKQYPHISVLLLVSIFLSLIGVYAAIVTFVLDSGFERRVVTRPKEAVRTSVGGTTSSLSKSSQPVIKKVRTALAVFNANTDTTIIQTENIVLHKFGNSEFTMIASFEEEGERISEPDKISLLMIIKSEDVTYATNYTFKVFLDNKLAFSSTNDLLVTENDDGIITAFLRQNEFSYKLFVKMSHAEKVRFQIGDTSFDLKKSNIQSFRDLVELVEDETIRGKETKLASYPVTEENDAPPIRKSVTTVVRPSH